MSKQLICFGGLLNQEYINRSDVDILSKSFSYLIQNVTLQREVRLSVAPRLERYDLRVVRYKSEFKEVLIKQGGSIFEYSEKIKEHWNELQPTIGFDFDNIE